MKSFHLAFLSLLLFAFVTVAVQQQLPFIEHFVNAVTESRALRGVGGRGNGGDHDFLMEELSPEQDSAREALLLCKVVNAVLPPEIVSCTCVEELLNGIFSFQCTGGKPRCITLPRVGSVCTKTSIGANLILNMFQLTITATVHTCGVQNSIRTNPTGPYKPMEDVCAYINATVGGSFDLTTGVKTRIGIENCGLRVGNRTCTSCFDCVRGNATGLFFSCGGDLKFCLPVNIPIFVDQPTNQGATLEDVLNLQAWTDAATELVKIAARKKKRRQFLEYKLINNNTQ